MKIINKDTIDEGDHGRDFIVSSIGLEQTRPGHTIGPWVRGKYIIHYVFGGKGTFNGVPVGRGSAFLICPNHLHTYVSDTDDPLKYGWISFLGRKADAVLQESGLPLRNHVFDCPWTDEVETLFGALCADRHESCETEDFLKGCFHLLLSFHKKAYRDSPAGGRRGSLRREHVRNAVKFIDDQYCHRLSVADVAAATFVSAHYLSNIFKEEMGVSPQQYILHVRMKRAVELLAIDGLSVTAVGISVGYPDVLAFSKAFRKTFGVSPREYRESLR